MEIALSIIAIVVSFVSLIVALIIYSKQKSEAIIQSFFDDFTSFLAYASTGKNDEARFTLIKLKSQAGFLKKDLYEEFCEILRVVEFLDLTKNNPNRDSDWRDIRKFILNFTKSYNPKSKLTMEFLREHL